MSKVLPERIVSRTILKCCGGIAWKFFKYVHVGNTKQTCGKLSERILWEISGGIPVEYFWNNQCKIS